MKLRAVALALVGAWIGAPLDARSAAYLANGSASGFCNFPDSEYSVGPSPVVASGNCANLGGSSTFSAGGGRQIAPGVVWPAFGASGQIGYTALAGPVSSGVQAHAGFLDEVTIPSGTTLHLEWAVEGREVISGDGAFDTNAASFRMRPGDVFEAIRGSARVGDTLYLDDLFAVDLPSAGNTPVELEPELAITMASVVGNGDERTYHALIEIGPVLLAAAEVRDMQGQPVPDAVVLSALGIDYVNRVPEPEPTAELGVAIASVAALACRRCV